MTTIGSTGTKPLNPFRPSATASGSTEPAGSPLSLVRQMVEEGSDLRKAAVKDKMERIKERLKMLVQMSLPPEVLARQLAMLGQQLNAATQQFAEGTALPASMAVAGGVPSADAGPATAGAATIGAGTDENVAEEPETKAPWGYAETEKLALDGPDDDDRDTIRELRGLAMQIKAMLRAAEADMRRETPQQPKSTPGIEELDAALSMLGAGVKANAASITLML